jgi:hypothetical protein
MLEFYFDFLDTFVDRQDFQLCEIDTDSLYMALSAQSLEVLVRPHLRETFFNEWSQWFPSETCNTHHKDFV